MGTDRLTDMPTTNGYYPVYLFYKEQNVLILAYGIGESFDMKKAGIHNQKQRIDEFLDNPFRYGTSYVFAHYEPKLEGNGSIFKGQ